MRFDAASPTNPIDRQRVVGRPVDRVDGPLKVTGRAPYAYETRIEGADVAYGHILGSAIARGRITRLDVDDAERAPGVIAVITHENAGPLAKGRDHGSRMLGGPTVEHFDQAIAVGVAETFEQARAAAGLIRIGYQRSEGSYDLSIAKAHAQPPAGGKDVAVGDFGKAFEGAAVKVDQTYTTPDQSHAMLEPHASLAMWRGDELTLWNSNQIVSWAVRDMAEILGVPKEKVRVLSPYVGGGFGAKVWVRADAVLAAVAARRTGRPVKVALTRQQVFNNTTHRHATVQRVRIGAGRDGRITAIAHESWSGNLPGAGPEPAADITRRAYAAPNRLTGNRLAELHLPEGNAMRAPGEATGLLALEVAMDELAEKLGMDPVRLRILNDTLSDPEDATRPFSTRDLVGCLRTGAARFSWDRRAPSPGRTRDGRWLVGMGMACAFRDNLVATSAARVRLDDRGVVTVETDMTDIGTGSYTIIAQTAAEMMGVPLDRVVVRLGDSRHPVSAGSGGQWGGNSSTAGVYVACTKLRDAIARKLGLEPATAVFEEGRVKRDATAVGVPLSAVAGRNGMAEDGVIEFGELTKRFAQGTFGAHFVEVGVDADTFETRVRRMTSVFAAGRILNPKTARSQMIGAMTMGIGAALMEEAVVDKRFGCFINHDLGEYHVPVHADVPHLDVIFLDEVDDKSSPMKAKGVGELGLCGVGAAVANAVFNATGTRVRDYPITLEKIMAGTPRSAAG